MRRHSIVRTALASALAGGLLMFGLGTAPAPALGTPLAAVPLAPPNISVANQKAHLQQLQNIASANGNTRRSTTAGYTASVTYVFDKLSAAGFSVVRQNCTSGCTAGAGPNIIADWNGGGGDPNQVYMLGAHLDSVSAGPGINDNGSGSATVLEIALTLAAQNPAMTGHARFAWWTDEEQGLNGSEFYVNSLSTTERAKIKTYFNFDMVASTNAGYFINRITSAAGQTVKAYYDSIGVPTEENVEGAGRSDDASFNSGGIQTSGVAAGASATKTSAQATKWGGTAGASYDPCYHRSCDTYPSNISDTVLDRAGDAAAYALWTLAVGTAASNDFSISASPTAGSVNPGSSTTATVSTAVVRGSAGTVTFSASGAPAGVSVAFSPASVTAGGSSTATISTTASAAPGTYTLTLTGTSASATHSATYALTVNGPPGCSATNDTDVQIPDQSTVNSPITVSGCAGNASSTATVEVHIVHTYSGDLIVSLIAPDGSAYTLRDQSGGSADNIDQTFTVNLSGEAANGTWNLRVQDAGPADVGYINIWTLNLGGGGTPACSGTNGADVQIPDLSTVNSPIAIAGCTGNASSTSTVEVHIVHTYSGDLVVSLVAPDGTVYTLRNRTGGSADNVDQTFTANLSSEVRNGTWNLRVQDAAAADVGYINSWTLTL